MIKKLLQEGFILKSKGYYKHAIEAFYKALEYDNSSIELWLEIAETYYLMGDEERALNYIEQILEKNPAHIDSLKLLKTIFIKKEAWIQAEQTAKNIYLISKTPENLTEIFRLLNKQEKFDEIFEYQLEEKTSEILHEMAYAKYMLQDFISADTYITQAWEKSKKNNLAFLLKGKILFKLNKKDECLEILNKMQLDENNAEIMNFAGLIKQYECEFKKAVDYFLRAIKLEPKNDEYYYNCASTFFKMDEIKLAKKYYNLAISINPENQNYHFALANLYYSERNFKRAMEELQYDFFEANLLKSIILYDTGYIAIAERGFKKLIEEQPENKMIQEYLSKINSEIRG